MIDEAAILRAIAALKDELTRTINERHATLAHQITELAADHHEAVLSQERRNSQFAMRDRVETVAQHAHDTASALTAILLRTSNLEQTARDHTTEYVFPLRVALTAILTSTAISSTVAIALHFVH
jgi:hypothetical protein